MSLLSTAQDVWNAGLKYVWKLETLTNKLGELIDFHPEILDLGSKVRWVTATIRHACRNDNEEDDEEDDES